MDPCGLDDHDLHNIQGDCLEAYQKALDEARSFIAAVGRERDHAFDERDLLEKAAREGYERYAGLPLHADGWEKVGVALRELEAHVAPAVARARELLALAPGWDSYSGRPVSRRCVDEAIRILPRLGPGWTPVPCPDGSVQLERHDRGSTSRSSSRRARGLCIDR